MKLRRLLAFICCENDRINNIIIIIVIMDTDLCTFKWFQLSALLHRLILIVISKQLLVTGD